ncbi:BTAD domain-containing putative transcriptional regulator [Fusobacterium simiae]|uniref:BTAD domain-containing putative transcriptional regulator n=1 Tax=Fusobacterium simiae TaxID=855 RepID=A0ABT4DKZ8_FUSSI|nr:BTAD domain-containing putative transcriptional regulator [Fusobacterium simiae]MCY7007939.1 BTAD domain-containing putative transcriptional regulator [Fusobacterium simiae]
MLDIKFLGKVKIEYDGVDITDKFGIKTKALLSLLILNRDKPLNREKIISYLWPDSTEDSGKFNLRFNLWQLRNIIGLDKNGNKFLHTGRSHCGINENYIYNCDVIDIKTFNLKENVSIKKLEELRKKFSGDFFEGFYFKNCNEFNENIILERSYFEEQKIKILLKLVSLYEIEENFEKCSEILKELVNIEPYDEEIALRMLEIYEKNGKRSLAILFYDDFKKKFMTFLGISPSEELEKKYFELKSKDILKEKTDVKNIVTTINKSELTLETHCIGEIEYYWINNLLDKIIEKININDYLNEKEIKDLGYININLFTDTLTLIPPNIRIMCILLKLLEEIVTKYNLVVKIIQIEKIDFISKIFLEEIVRRNLISIKE